MYPAYSRSSFSDGITIVIRHYVIQPLPLDDTPNDIEYLLLPKLKSVFYKIQIPFCRFTIFLKNITNRPKFTIFLKKKMKIGNSREFLQCSRNTSCQV